VHSISPAYKRSSKKDICVRESRNRNPSQERTMTEQQPGRDRNKELRTMLQIQDSASLAGSLGKFLMGMGWCLVVGLVFATLIYGILESLTGSAWIGWWGWFGLYVLILVPLLILQERRGREDYLLNAVDGTDSASSRGEYEMNKMRLQVGVYASMLVWGPRALLDGLRGMRGRRTLLQEKLFDRAVILVFDLARHDGGVEIKHLLHPPEDMKAFGDAVDWLDAHDWIGKATAGGSMWLSSLGRKRLVERGLNPAQAQRG
jgi:hypothetical protein